MAHIYMFRPLTGHQEDFPQQIQVIHASSVCEYYVMKSAYEKQVNKTKPLKSINEHRQTR